jgi:purine-nucleoside phosphorylase
MGVEVAAISLVTNYAAGIADHKLSHDEVTETANAAMGRFAAVLESLIPRLASA